MSTPYKGASVGAAVCWLPRIRTDTITAPILLIPGEGDDSQASKPIESLKLFHALRGHGAIARLVLLPRENHACAARESILDDRKHYREIEGRRAGVGRVHSSDEAE